MSLIHASYINPETTKIFTENECKEFEPELYKDMKYIIKCDLYAPKDL